MLRRLFFIGILMYAVPVYAEQTEQHTFEITEKACEKQINHESKSSTRIRASDKAIFTGIKKLPPIQNLQKKLDEYEINILVGRLVDEYVEDFSETIQAEDNRVCVKVHGWLSQDNIFLVEKDFLADKASDSEDEEKKVIQAAAEVKKQFSAKPEDPENLALVYIGKVKYFNGAETSRFVPELKKRFADNAYFYLTEDKEVADYILTPRVLKAKVDSLDAGHKRLQMVVSIDIEGIEKEAVSEYQNRFVLFGTEEDEQKIAARLIRKLIENASDGALRRVERKEELKLEQKKFGKTISQ